MLASGAAAQSIKETCPRDTVDGQIIYRYTVEKSIGLWRISQNFGVSQESILEANPFLKERGLHLDEVILIPGEKVEAKPEPVVEEKIVEEKMEPVVEAKPEPKKAKEAKEVMKHLAEKVEAKAVVAEPVTVVAESVAEVVEESVADTVAETSIEDTVLLDPIKMAILLPLQTNAPQRDANMDRFVDFYEGALLAINQVQQRGQKIELYVYDVEKTDMRIRQLIADSVLNDMQAIIGPAYAIQVAHIAEFTRKHPIPTLIPFSDQVPGIETNPSMMQFNATEKQKAELVADYLQMMDTTTGVNCVLVEAKDADIPQSILALRKEIIRRGLPHRWTTIHNVLVDSLGTALKDSVANVLIFNTEKYGNLQVLMPRVLNAKMGKDVRLYSHFSWQKEHILLPQIYTTVFTTESEADMTAYEADWNRYYGHERATQNPRYDLLGYDLTAALLAHLRGKDSQGLQADIHFEKIGEEGGYINTGLKVKSEE